MVGPFLFFNNIFTPAILFGEGFCAYLCSCLLGRILTLCEPPQETEEEGKCEAAL